MQTMSEIKSLQMQLPPLFTCSMPIDFHSATSPELPVLELKPLLLFLVLQIYKEVLGKTGSNDSH